MKTFIQFSLVLTLLLTLSVPSFAQQEQYGAGRIDDLEGWQRAGQAAMPFLAAGAGGRMMAMGDAGAAEVRDASALFYNPAGLAFVDKYSVMLGSNSWIMDTKMNYGAAAMTFKNIGTFGVSAMFFDYGDPIQATEIATNESGYNDIGTLEPSEYVLGVGYARQISSQFAIGAQFKYAYQDLLGGTGVSTRIAYETADGWIQESHEANKGVIAFDIGTMYNTGFRNLTIAMSIRNFGQEVKYEAESYDLPLTFRIATTASVFELLNKEKEGMDLRVNIDYLHPHDWSEQLNTGLEYSLNKMLYVRAGYKFNYSSEGLTLGAGFNLNLPQGDFRLDYAYKDTGDTLFDAVHVYSLSMDF